MTKIKKPKISLATYIIKGYHSSWMAALGGFFTLFFSIALLIVTVEAKDVLSNTEMTISLAVVCSALGLSVSAFVGGLVLTDIIKKKDCIIFFDKSITVYEFRSLFNCGYRVFDYEELAEYRFIQQWDRSERRLLDCDFFNYGWLKLKDSAGKEYKIPVSDIKQTGELLKQYTGKESSGKIRG